MFILLSVNAFAQSNLLGEQDLSKFKADNLTEVQVRDFISEYEKAGYSITQVGQGAVQSGMPVEEWNKLHNRIMSIKSTNQQNTSDDLSRTITESTLIKPSIFESEDKVSEKNIFGSSLFTRTSLTFEPNLQLPTPENYQLGPGDELIVDVYGFAENAYRLTVSPEGYIRIPRVGPVQVSGLSIQQAKKSIIKQLSSIYTTIHSGETSVSVSLGNIRSINVIMIGEVYRPGTYTLPSVASIFNALNVAGGPNDNGSFRNIKLIRNNEVIAKIDIYDFLLSGELKNNLILQDQDVIKIEPYSQRIELEGELKNTGLFETIEGETFLNLVTFAGGFTNTAYTDRVTVYRNTNKERSVANVSNADFGKFVLQNGDNITVGKILDRFLNRVQIEGAVYRPGTYALENGMTLKELIENADGIRDDAFLNRATIKREREDKTKEMISFNVGELLNGSVNDIPLKKEDIVYIASTTDLQQEQTISIWGEIKNEGEYDFYENMSMKDLILLAGGVKNEAELREIEVSRLITDPDMLRTGKERTVTYKLSTDKDLGLKDEFLLKPFDQVIIRPISGFEYAKKITISGEVYYPGSYIITSKNERISDVIMRSGGLNQYAYPEGAFLIRKKKNTFAEKKLDESVMVSVSQDSAFKVDKNEFLRNDGIVGIDLVKILQNPRSKWDLILEEGDVISIPKQLQTVQVSGEVFLPVHVRYDKSMSFTDYVDNAGGFSNNAIRRKSFVIYANGMARSTKNFLFFKKYPKIEPGAHLFIPARPERRGLTTGEAIGIATSTTSLAAVLMSLIRTF